jgi:hypothetical protein
VKLLFTRMAIKEKLVVCVMACDIDADKFLLLLRLPPAQRLSRPFIHKHPGFLTASVGNPGNYDR